MKWKLLGPWNSPGRNAGVGSLSLLEGIFPTQGLNPGLPHGRQIFYHLSHQGSPRMLEWVAYPFSSGSSQPRNRTGVSCTAGGFFTNWATREPYFLKNWGIMCMEQKGQILIIHLVFNPSGGPNSFPEMPQATETSALYLSPSSYTGYAWVTSGRTWEGWMLLLHITLIQYASFPSRLKVIFVLALQCL